MTVGDLVKDKANVFLVAKKENIFAGFERRIYTDERPAIYDFAYPNKPSKEMRNVESFFEIIPRRRTRFKKKMECKGESVTMYASRAIEPCEVNKISKVFNFPK